MFAPVISSSLTTIAAFLPLALIGGTMGKIIFDLPTVIICVIIASVVECFIILPTLVTLLFFFLSLTHKNGIAKTKKIAAKKV